MMPRDRGTRISTRYQFCSDQQSIDVCLCGLYERGVREEAPEFREVSRVFSEDMPG